MKSEAFMTTQADAVAHIALGMPEEVNLRAVLRALNIAYSAGFEAGAAAANQNHLRMQEMIMKLQNKVLAP